MDMKRNAYFTVEAALVFPLVLSALLMTVYLFLFQYDRCLLEQDMQLLALYAADIRTEDAADVQKRVQDLYLDKYAAWTMPRENIKVTIKGAEVICSGSGELRLPIPGWNLFSDRKFYLHEYSCKLARTDPVGSIRLYRKLKKWKEKES
ncbi:MAG: hypothetical protein MJ114_08305 [Acetatifactor sp.]|nr:hypothetical protein [Acetatifactor sp.]